MMRVQRLCERFLQKRPWWYADGKPRPQCRGALHGVLSVALLSGIVFSERSSLTLGLTGKLITYSASATFHLYPFETVDGVTRAFVVDVLCVPFSVCGALAPFVTNDDGPLQARLAVGVVVVNAAAVARQCRGQVGLRTPTDRTELPRSVVVGVYSVYALGYVGLRAGFWGAWIPMFVLLVLATSVATAVTEAHDLEPTSRHALWHTPGMWSFHEDFHLLLFASDVAWLVLAIGYLAERS